VGDAYPRELQFIQLLAIAASRRVVLVSWALARVPAPQAARTHALRYVHGGWIAALALSARYLVLRHTRVIAVERRPAARSTEGTWRARRRREAAVRGLLAARQVPRPGVARLPHARREDVKTGAGVGLALMAFLAVYREVFETVLFYERCGSRRRSRRAIGAGFGVGLAALGALTWAMLRFSIRLPLGCSSVRAASCSPCSRWCSRQRNRRAAGSRSHPDHPVAFVTIGWLGIHPNAQALARRPSSAPSRPPSSVASRRR
jgi:hypothetical protein